MTADSPTYENVLIPTDGSNRAEYAADHAIELADQIDATVHVVHVVNQRQYGETPALSSYELAFEQLEEQGEEYTQELAEQAHERDLDVETAVTRGLPHEEIVEYAESHGIDLIVMGRAGAGGVEMPHIGSVTDRVIRTTKTPVLPV